MWSSRSTRSTKPFARVRSIPEKKYIPVCIEIRVPSNTNYTKTTLLGSHFRHRRSSQSACARAKFCTHTHVRAIWWSAYVHQHGGTPHCSTITQRTVLLLQFLQRYVFLEASTSGCCQCSQCSPTQNISLARFMKSRLQKAAMRSHILRRLGRATCRHQLHHPSAMNPSTSIAAAKLTTSSAYAWHISLPLQLFPWSWAPCQLVELTGLELV